MDLLGEMKNEDELAEAEGEDTDPDSLLSWSSCCSLSLLFSSSSCSSLGQHISATVVQLAVSRQQEHLAGTRSCTVQFQPETKVSGKKKQGRYLDNSSRRSVRRRAASFLFSSATLSRQSEPSLGSAKILLVLTHGNYSVQQAKTNCVVCHAFAACRH